MNSSVRPQPVPPESGDGIDCDLGPAVEEEAAGGRSLRHPGEPGSDNEVRVMKEPRSVDESLVKVVHTPRMPTQAEIDAHVAAHLPHGDRCEICVKARGRMNKSRVGK